MSEAASALVYSGGYAHPFGQSSAALAEALARHGWNVRIDEDLADVLADLSSVGLLAVNALRWSMAQDEKYAPHRAAHAFAMDDAQFAAIEAFVAGGGSLLALHTAVICWDDQPGWRDLLGGGWEWGRSHHPPLGAVVVTPTNEGIALGLLAQSFSVIDEAYHRLNPTSDCCILATAQVAQGPQPVVWTRRYGRGRVAVDALGHDARSLSASGHMDLLAALLGWLGATDDG